MLKKSLGILIILLLLCTLLFFGEWGYTEFTYRTWLQQDARRIDTSIYTSEAQLQTAILKKVPIGSSEENVKSFFFANADPSGIRINNWKPLERADCKRITLAVWQTNRGHIIRRAIQGEWLIRFYLDKGDGSLKNVDVEYYGFPL